MGMLAAIVNVPHALSFSAFTTTSPSTMRMRIGHGGLTMNVNPKAPIMINSPCAKLMRRMIPNRRPMPREKSAKRLPRLMPSIVYSMVR